VSAVAGIVLAGGASRRMGEAKAGLVHDGRTFLARVVGALRDGGIADLVVVSGSAHDDVLAALPSGDPAHVVRNPDPERGQLSSLKVALEELGRRRPRPDAALMALVDHPAIAAATVRRLLGAWSDANVAGAAAPSAIVLPTHEGRRGHPVLFAARVWAELLATPDVLGARAVVHADAARVLEVPVADAGVHIDVDTPDDFLRLTSGPG
jgi:molybdenum cofactor cytidylyltransferase